jgi:outer membrane receptor protein involved in Fe transport
MEVRGSASFPRDRELHSSHRQAHPHGDRDRSHPARHRNHPLRRIGRGLHRLAALTVLFFGGAEAEAIESRLIDAEGKPVAGAQISVADQRTTTRTDLDGNFTLTPDPQLPATLIVVGSRGELFPPIYVTQFGAEIHLDPSYRESISVTAGATPNIEGTPASAPIVFGSEEIEQRKPAHVVEAIATAPGVSIRGEGPPAVPVVRGLAGGRTLILIDDARIVAERRAGASATFVDPISLGSIEVSRGPGSVAYGSDAFGGVVHLRPRDPIPGQPDIRYDAWAAFGGLNTRSAAIEFSTDALGGAVLTSVHARSADNAHDANGDETPNSGYDDRGAMFRYVRDSAWGRLRAGVMTSNARDVGAPSTDSVQTVYPDERATLGTLALDLPGRGAWTSAAVRASFGTYSITTNRIRTTGVESAVVKSRDASLRFSGERAAGRSRITTGVDFVSRFNLTATGVPASESIDDADRYDTGVYASWTGAMSNVLQLSAGVRGDHVATRNTGGYFGDRSTSDIAPSGFFAATAGPFRGFTTTLQVASGYREPSLSDRYFRGISGRGFVTGNPDLEPERSTQLDAGIRWNGTRTRVALYAYDYRIKDLVERFRTGNDFFFRNRGEADVRGMELEVGTRLPMNFDLQLGASIARGEDADTHQALDDIAPRTLQGSLRWAAERASAFVNAIAFARDDRPGPVETVRPGFAEIDAGAGWRIHPMFEVRVVVRNLLNADHAGSADAVAALAPGRSVMIGINR